MDLIERLYPMNAAKRYPVSLERRKSVTLSARYDQIVAIKDGKLLVSNASNQNAVNSWKDIVQVDGCGATTYGSSIRALTKNGTVLQLGSNTCWGGESTTSAWTNVIEVQAWGDTTSAVLSSGNFVSAGHDAFASSWTGIVHAIGSGHSVCALKSDGSTVIYGGGYRGGTPKISMLNGVVDIAYSDDYDATLIGLKADGTCSVVSEKNRFSDVKNWTNIVDINFGFCNGNVVGLRKDGTVVVAGDNTYGQCNVSDWKDIIAVQSGLHYTVGLKKDGSLVVAGKAPADVSKWVVDIPRYGKSFGLLTSKSPINLLDKSTVNGFTVAGVEPEKTERRVVFKVDDKWNKLTITSGTAALTPLTTQDITAYSVLKEGNTAAEISSVTSCPPMVGKLVYPAVALYADESATVMPTFGLTVKAAIDTTVNVYTYTDYSQEYSFGRDDVNLVSLVAETETKGGGKVDITARIKTAGTWSEYQPLNNCQMKQASAVQLKAVYSVQSTDGSDSAAIKSVTVTYSTSGATVADATTDIVTVTKRFSYDLSYVHAYIKHKQLIDAKINAYCALRKRPAYRDMVQVGNGTGSLTTYKLADAGINQDTLKVYVDGKAINDYGYNTETSELTITADKDAVISASYEYGWELSTWKQMTQGETQINDSGEYTTEYAYNVPAHDGVYTVTAVKYSLERPTGHVEEETIGTGTGKRQLIKLPHIARKETIVCNGSWSYDYDRQLLTIIAPEKEPIVISYDWIAETPEVHAVGAGWAD